MTDERLSHIERRLLRVLGQTPGRIVPHAELLRSGWGYDLDGIAERHVLRQTLSRLRKKLAPDMEIENSPRRGYRLLYRHQNRDDQPADAIHHQAT